MAGFNVKFIVLSSLLAQVVVAHDVPDEAVDEPKGPWSGSFGAGYLASSGNTDDSSVTVAFALNYDKAVWHHALNGRFFGASSQEPVTNESFTTSESYQAGWKSSYDFSEHNYTFGQINWIKDRFSGFPEQTFATAGYGRRLLETEKFVLNAEIGGGYSKQKVRIDEFVTERQDGGVITAGGDFAWKISDNATFEQVLAIFSTSDNTFTESITRLHAGLIGNVGLSLSYTVRNNSDVAPELEKTDTYTAASLEYSF